MANAFGYNPNNSLENILRSAVSNANAGVSAAQSGVNAVLGGQGVVNDSVSGMKQNAAQITNTANNVLNTASTAQATYDKLIPIAEQLGLKADNLWSEGSALSDRALSLFGMGDSILNKDPSAGGLAGEYLKMYNLLSPDRYVSRAASDTQAAFQNAQGQAERNLARRGVSAGSGASLALQKQYATALATALASAKTRARDQGITEQSAYLDKMLSAANTLYGTGNQTEQNALTAKNQSVGATNNQASVTAAQGSGYISVGGLQKDAGSMFASAASVLGDAAKLNTDYLSQLSSAYGTLASSNGSAAKTKISAASNEVSANNGGGGSGGSSGGGSGGSSGGGFTVSSPTWTKSDSRRGDDGRWVTTWTNSKTGTQVSGDAFFNPNK